jgi:outer membrane protein assembly factor BamB
MVVKLLNLHSIIFNEVQMCILKPLKILIVLSILFPFLLFAEDWPRFRGPTGQGISQEKNLPVKWSATEGILWKTAIPGEGYSSPIVYDQKIFVTSVEDSGASCRLICIDFKSGNLMWNNEVFRQVPGHKEERNSYASPTPVTDGKHVYVTFSDGSIAAVTMEGKEVWHNRDNQFHSQHGRGVSPILFENILIIPFDASHRPPDIDIGWQDPWDKGFVLALDKNNGEEFWKVKRGLSRIAHSTPIIINYQGEPRLISIGGDVVQGFEPKTGKRIWTTKNSGEGVIPSPVSGEDLVFSTSGWGDPAIRAIRLGGEGEVTDTHLAWELKENVPMIPSFIYYDSYLYSITGRGKAMCLLAKTGEIVWEQRLGGRYSASPVYADGKIYFLSEKGVTTIIEASPVFKEIAKNDIGEQFCKASSAISDGKILIRAEKHLYCIVKAEE